jgi:hypothetical protein
MKELAGGSKSGDERKGKARAPGRGCPGLPPFHPASPRERPHTPLWRWTLTLTDLVGPQGT